MKNTQILTGLTYYQYHLIGGLTFACFAIYQFVYGNFYVGITNTVATLSILALIACGFFYKDSHLIKSVILLIIISAILSASYFVGLGGVIWLYPIVMAIFFNHNGKCAAILSVLTITLTLYLASYQVEASLLFKIFLSLLLCIAFAYVYRTAILKKQGELKRAADTDFLTGISNRRSFQNWLNRSISVHRQTHHLLAVYFLDLDDFKYLNDSYGHEFGDKVLKEVSDRLANSVRDTDIVSWQENSQLARIAGDEFVIATSFLNHQKDADIIARRLLAAINTPLVLDSITLTLSGSIGVTLCQDRITCAKTLLQEADAAMYRSKERGKNCITYFDDDIASKILERQAIAKGLETALQNDEFELHFMPTFRINDNQQHEITGAEVLIRCYSDALVNYGPDKYIPVAEEFGIIKAIDLLVIEKAFTTIQTVTHLLPDEFILAINISAQELRNKEFPKQLASLKARHNIDASRIELEVTETSLITHDETIADMLEKIKTLGFRLALDDFGTGYTAFSQLHDYPIDTLKIDRSFVWNITEEDHQKQKMVDIILSLKKLYGVKAIAEGVEEQFQLDYLLASGCDLFQGYLLSKPLPWETFRSTYLESADHQSTQ